MTAVEQYDRAVGLLERAWRSGDDALLDRAVEQLRRMAGEVPADDGAVLSSLGVALHQRYQRSGDRDDLDEAVAAHRRAVASCAEGHPDRVAVLANTVCRQAVEITPRGHPRTVQPGQRPACQTPPRPRPRGR